MNETSVPAPPIPPLPRFNYFVDEVEWCPGGSLSRRCEPNEEVVRTLTIHDKQGEPSHYLVIRYWR